MTDDSCAICQSPLPPGFGLCPSCGAVCSLPVGSTLHHGKFAVGHVLGEGSFGITYKGAHKELHRPVAIKELFPIAMGVARAGTRVSVSSMHRGGFRRAQDSVLEEARVIAGFRSLYIVDIYDMFRENGTVYIVMEYLDGPTLETRLQETGTLSAREVRHLALNLCEVLEEMHGYNLLHCNIKPTNIVWLPNGRTVLIDFGSARLLDAGMTMQHARILTEEYAAPEQYSPRARFEPYLGPYTDLFGLGATLYHAVTGATPVGFVERLQGRDMVFPEDLDASLRTTLQSALAFPVAERPQTVADFRRGLLGTGVVPAATTNAGRAPAPSVKPRLQVAAITYFNQGCAKEQLGQHAAAIADYDHALRLDPNSAAAYRNRGWNLGQLGQHTAAIADYDHALRLDPNSATAYRNRGWNLGQLGQHTAAIANYNHALHLDPNDAMAYNSRGVAKAELGQHAEAIEDYDHTLRLDPNYATAYRNRGVAKAELGQHAEAIEDYDHTLRLDPNDATAYNNRGVAKAELGQCAEIADYDYFQRLAIEDYDHALRLDPNNITTYHNRGMAKEALRQHVEAIADYNHILCLAPNDATAYNNRGRATYKYGVRAKAELEQRTEAIEDYDRALCFAIEDYDHALRLDPNYVTAYRNRGVAKAELGQHAEAIADYDYALRLDPNDAMAYLNRGEAKTELGQHAEAIEDYDHALLLLDPNNAVAYLACLRREDAVYQLNSEYNGQPS